MDQQTIDWLRQLAEKGGRGVVNNIDARSLGRIADKIECLRTFNRELALGMVAAGSVDIRTISEITRQIFIDLTMMEPPLVDMDGPWIFLTEEGRKHFTS